MQAVWALLPHPAFSEQAILALLVTFALSALAAFFVAEDLPSPACAKASEARQASVQLIINFFIRFRIVRLLRQHFQVAYLERLSKGMSLFMPVCAGFARLFLRGLLCVVPAFGFRAVRRFSVGRGYFGLNGSRRFDCWQGDRQHESRDCRNKDEFLHRVKWLNSTQLELSTFSRQRKLAEE